MATNLQTDQRWATPDPEPPSRPSLRETTRYLCAAAYSDGAFRDTVLKHERETVRARPPEVGIDVKLIGEHCHRALHTKMIRDLLICLPSLVFFINLLTGLSSGLDGEIAPATMQVFYYCWLAATFIIAVEAFRLDSKIRHELTREGFREQVVTTGDPGNVVVYSGFSPFIGAGSDLGGWSFAIDLERRKHAIAESPRPFELTELYDHVSDVFARLRIPNLKLNRKLFISGRCVRGNTDFLPDIHERPVDSVPDEIVARYADNSARQVRHYLCVENVDWDGELAVTLFIRLQILSSKLFVELSAFLLPPLKPAYYDLDKVHSRRRFRESVSMMIVALFKGPFLLVMAPFATLGRLQTGMANGRARSEQHEQIDHDLLFDYGAEKSMRETAAGNEWRVYFQKLDKEMHHKILQQQLLDALVDFLDNHGIDTSDIKERTTHILNNGVIVSGGSLNAEGMAVDEKAKVKVQHAHGKVGG